MDRIAFAVGTMGLEDMAEGVMVYLEIQRRMPSKNNKGGPKESASTVGAERAVRLPDQPAALGAAEGSSMVSSAVQTITSPEAHPSVQASSGSLAAAVTGPSQPAALASTSSAVAGSTQSVGSTAASTDVAGREQLVTAVPAGTARLVHRWRILVCGHNYVHWVERYARNSSFGQHLGCTSTAFVEWKGVRGLRWASAPYRR
nr:uncharacterized protein LOC132769751 [Anolis sagrei ordinatus]